MTEDYTYHGPMLTGRHPHIGPMPADATVLQPAEMAALRASLAALEAALVEAEAERAQLVARAEAAERDASDVRKWADAVPVDAISTVVCAAEPILNDARHRNALDAIRHWATQPEAQP